MSDKCSYRGALDRQATENHRRVACTRKEQQRRIDDSYANEEKPVIELVKTQRRKPGTKSTGAKSTG